MTDFGAQTSTIQKLNGSNYSIKSLQMKFYLKGKELWSIVGGNEIEPPTEANDMEKWEVKAAKAMFSPTVATLKEAWDTLATLFTKTNEAKLQALDNELMKLQNCLRKKCPTRPDCKE
ncbi:hypothetical protein ES332_A08G298500v1 [Gossypium tomentosum]|uniref:DUF4219 domain-containing protein n=1 Tax=Gossypium tomentosum TaxID=34277 RepID=A0A5D2PP97_GOSTO|nr:hypothetical protein ES332_A08G298500v1 [Gossypium tomentosum]